MKQGFLSPPTTVAQTKMALSPPARFSSHVGEAQSPYTWGLPTARV